MTEEKHKHTTIKYYTFEIYYGICEQRSEIFVKINFFFFFFFFFLGGGGGGGSGWGVRMDVNEELKFL